MKMNLISIFACASAMLLAGVSCGNTIEPDDNNPYKSLELTTKSMEFVEKGNTFAFNFMFIPLFCHQSLHLNLFCLQS